MKITRLSVYDSIKEGASNALDTTLYSKFKYGHRPTAVIFAVKMFKTFLKEFNNEWLKDHNDQLVITTSPYWFTPPAAHALVAHVHHMLNERYMRLGLTPVRYVKIHRSSAPVTDFSKLGEEERKLNMKRDSLSVDPEALKGKVLLVVEDSRITGAHEEKTIKFAEEMGVKHIIFVYIISLKNGASDPDVENRINHIAMSDLTMLHRLMLTPEDFAFNSRVCRFLLSWPNIEDLTQFFKYLSDQLLFTVYASSINDGYALSDKFKAGFEVVRNEVESRDNLSIHSEETPVISIAASQH